MSDRVLGRRLAIMKAARTAFLTNGYAGTSLDEIIEQVGGSRRNVYELFGNKEGLFHAVLKQQINDLVGMFETLPSEDGPPEEWLMCLGLSFVNALLNAEVIAMFRQFIEVAAVRPDIGREAYDNGPRMVFDRLSAYLENQTKKGHLHVAHPDIAARAFMEMVKGGFEIEALMTGTIHSDAEQIERHVREATRIFLYGSLSR